MQSRATAAVVHQGILEQVLREIFAAENISTNVRKRASLTNPTSGSFLEIDIWLPDHGLCFEFQDVYHYTTTWDSQFPLTHIRDKDNIQLLHTKKEMVRARLETLILVPCWWDSDKESLISSVQFYRPDVLLSSSSNASPIALNPPLDFFDFDGIPDVGELMLASFPTVPLSLLFDAAWWLGEKYDGIRCCWNSDCRELYSRKAMVLVLPEAMQASITTNNFLDAELWFGRGTFGSSQKISNPFGEAAPLDWDLLRMINFDQPHPSMKPLEFEKRYTALVDDPALPVHPFLISFLLLLLLQYENTKSSLITIQVIASRWLCVDKATLGAAAKLIIKDGGEGVILRRINSLYVNGRSPDLIKFKADRGDQEALVMEVKSQVYILQLPDGTLFELSNPTLPEDVKPRKGDIVTFTYSNFSRTSVPVQPKIFRIRKDVTWKDIVQNYANDAAQAKQMNDRGNTAIGNNTHMPTGYWTSKKNRNMRTLLETFAKRSGFDFLVPNNWYKCKREDFAKLKGSRSVLGYFNGSFTRAIMRLFPEIGLEETKFQFLPQNYWKNAKNRRKFFERVAKRHNFDPLSAKNWYKANFIELRKQKGASAVLGYYNNSVINALIHLFPEIDLVVEDFYDLPKGYWINQKNHKKFLLDLAASHGFDPLIPANWYRLQLDDFKEFKSGSSFLSYYRRSYITALVHHFPNIGLQRHEFVNMQKHFWADVENRKLFFEKFAKDRGFSSRDPSAWYFVKIKDLLQVKRAPSVVAHAPNQDPILAIMEAFPDIGLVRHKFIPDGHWLYASNRKRFFEDFAQENSFDPLESSNWLTITKEQILNHKKGAEEVMKYYNMKHLKATSELFGKTKDSGM